MTEHPETQAGTTKTVTFSQTSSTTWAGSCTCPHGSTRNATSQIVPGVPPLNHAQMVQSLYRQHDLVIGCTCTYAQPTPNANVSFALPVTGIPVGQQRYIPQLSATIANSNLWWGPGLTCAKAGAYQVDAKIQLARPLGSAGGGAIVLVIQGVPVISNALIDESNLATGYINAAVINLTPNQSINLGFENTTTIVRDINVASLKIGDIWIP